MKTKETILYDSYYSEEKELDARQYLFDEYGNEEKWNSPQDVPDFKVFREIELQDDMCWEEMKFDLEILFKNDYFLLTGYCGTWHGNMEGGKFINSLPELLSVIQHLDDFRIIDRNGHFIIEGSHHDGSDRYELKRLTRKGYELANSNYFANDRKLHNTIMKNNLYSGLPHFAQKVYCL